MQSRSFVQYLHFHDFEILESRKHSGCCDFEVVQALILNKSPGSAKPSPNINHCFRLILIRQKLIYHM
ncbi:MAG TPA: hypothetical protein VKA34_22260 [Balneolales bacterium]|nr:hypothetical protein [Balneolales bacterium]